MQMHANRRKPKSLLAVAVAVVAATVVVFVRRFSRRRHRATTTLRSSLLLTLLLPLLLTNLDSDGSGGGGSVSVGLGFGIGGAAAHLHKYKWNAMLNAFRMLQETMLRNSLERAHLNYGIVFECRTVSNMKYGEEAHFSLQLGDLRGFRRLDARKKLALFLHGWNDQGSKDWVQEMLQTWTHFDAGYNVCVVDWGHLSSMDYKTASMSIFDVGLTVAGIIMALEELRPQHFHRSNVTIAGYSLGAHAAGYAGAVLNSEIEQIIGLDPAGPLFTLPAAVAPEFRLDMTDARYVQVLHTSGGTLGTSLKCGHADYFPNGGKAPQRNCRMFMKLTDMQNTNPIACSHSTAAVFFKQSMDPQYPFVGQHCDSWKEYQAGKCAANRWARFGIHSQRKMHGNFYFTTEAHKPYVRRQQANAAFRRFAGGAGAGAGGVSLVGSGVGGISIDRGLVRIWRRRQRII